MQSLCRQVKVYHIHNHYYCCQNHPKNVESKPKRKAISLNNNILLHQNEKNQKLQMSQSFRQRNTFKLLNDKLIQKPIRKGISVSLKNQSIFQKSLVDTKPKKIEIKLQPIIIPKQIRNIHKCKQISYVNSRLHQSTFKKQNLFSTKQSNYQNSLFVSTIKKQIKKQQKKLLENIFKSLKTQINQQNNLKNDQLSRLIYNSCQSLNFNQKYENQYNKFKQLTFFNRQKISLSNSRIKKKEKILTSIVKSNHQPENGDSLKDDFAFQEIQKCIVGVQQSKNSKNNFILTAQDRAKIIDRQTIVSHYYYDQTDKNDSYILDQSLIMQRQTLKNFIKKNILVQNQVFALYLGIDMQLGIQVSIKQFNQGFKQIFQLEENIYKSFSKEEFFELLELKQTIENQNLVLIKQGFQTTLGLFLSSLQNIKIAEETLFYLLNNLLISLKYKNLCISSQCILSDFVMTKQKRIKAENPFILELLTSDEKSSAQYLTSKLVNLFVKSAEYQQYS